MKRFTIVLLLALLRVPAFAQYATNADYNLSAEYIESTTHWTDPLVTIPLIGIIPYFLYK